MSFFPMEQLEQAGSPLVHVHLGPDGLAVGATAATILPAPPERVWSLLADVERLGEFIPMLDRVSRQGTRWKLDLRFRVTLLSVGFGFVAEERVEPGRVHELRAISGEPRDLVIRHELELAPSGGTAVHAMVGFDITSLGWLVKVFLRHHPEIRFGTMAGVPLTLLDAAGRALARR